VNRLFAPPPGFDVSSLFADDAVWWNGLPRLRGLEGSCEHEGIEAIRKILTGSGTDLRRFGIDAYLTEHWNTWWADRFLFDQLPPEPPHPLPPKP
jgi:hypothetical protein